jgi:GMP reductase
MRIIDEEQLEFDDVSIQPKRSMLNSRSEVDIYRTFKWTSIDGNTHELTCKPVISAIMTTVGTTKMAYELVSRGYLASIEKHISYDDINKLYNDLINLAHEKGENIHYFTDRISLSIGLNDSLDMLKKLALEHKVNIINVDCPNAYIPNFKKRVKEIRDLFPDAFMIAGVVVTSDLTTDLVNMGVNCISMGINAGSVCCTAEKTAVYRPLLSMIIDCADAAHQQNAYVMLSGGIKGCRDACVALGAGCDILMSGSLFAGTDEADGEIISKRYETSEIEHAFANLTISKRIEKKFKKYFGMASKYAMTLYSSGGNYKTDEGRMKLIPYVGSLDSVLSELEGGIKSMMCFIGAKTMKEIPKKTTFYKIHHGLNDKFKSCESFSS